MTWGIHVLYIAVILILLAFVLMTWRAHINSGTALSRVNCLVAEMFLDHSRYASIGKIFADFINDNRQPINRSSLEHGDFNASRQYWLSSAFQIEKATQQLMVSESREYIGLAVALHSYFTKRSDQRTSMPPL
jgi:hypothetical protein